MKYQALLSHKIFKRTLVCVALAAAYSSSWALPQFTFTPSGASPALVGTPITADNILLSDFAAVTLTGGPSATTFSEAGFLSVTGFQLGGTNVFTDGLNSTYSLYFQFNATGHLTNGTNSTNVTTTPTNGVFDTLTFSLLGANGNSTFGFSGNTPTVSNVGAPVTLATGSLMTGFTSTSPAAGGAGFAPTANSNMSFAVASGEQGFFSPNPFYMAAFSAFTNNSQTVTAFSGGGGFRINNGGGNLSFASPIPEPETYALMLAGLGVMGWVARRRKKS